MEAAMLCRISKSQHGGTCSSPHLRKTKFACSVAADESTRRRLEGSLPKGHEDHIAGRGISSLDHYNLVHKFIPMSKAMKIPEAKAAVHTNCEKLEKFSARQLTKVRTKKEVIDEARKECRTVHFATLMDICNLQNAELEPQFQKYKGSVVLRGDIVKTIQDLTQYSPSKDHHHRR